MKNLRLTDRDWLILKEVGRWRAVLGRHIKALAGFEGIRACDRRIKILIDSGYLKRQKILYGYQYFCTLSYKSRLLLNLNKRDDKIRVEQIRHDVYVLDTVIQLLHKNQIALDNIQTEKELHQQDGFSNRNHRPDFVFEQSGEKIAFEIELSLKSRERLERNIKDNFNKYKMQLWFIERKNKKLESMSFQS